MTKSGFLVGEVELNQDEKMGYSFKFLTATSATANNGAIPFGRTISTAAVTVFDIDGTNVTNLFIEDTTLVGDTVTVIFQYPGSDYEGQYKAVFKLTLDNGWVSTEVFSNVYVRAI